MGNQKTMGIALTKDIVERLDEEAKKNHRSRSNMIETIIMNYFSGNEKCRCDHERN